MLEQRRRARAREVTAEAASRHQRLPHKRSRRAKEVADPAQSQTNRGRRARQSAAARHAPLPTYDPEGDEPADLVGDDHEEEEDDEDDVYRRGSDDDDDDVAAEEFAQMRKRNYARRQAQEAKAERHRQRFNRGKQAGAAASASARAGSGTFPRSKRSKRQKDADDDGGADGDGLVSEEAFTSRSSSSLERPALGTAAGCGPEEAVGLWDGKPAERYSHERWLASAMSVEPWKLLNKVAVAVPARLAMYLRPYQIEGVKRMASWLHAGHGGVLADDVVGGNQMLARITASEHPFLQTPFLLR